MGSRPFYLITAHIYIDLDGKRMLVPVAVEACWAFGYREAFQFATLKVSCDAPKEDLKRLA